MMFYCVTFAVIGILMRQTGNAQRTAATAADAVDQPVECEMENGSAGYCVRYYQCKTNHFINVDGENLIDKRTFNECPHYLDKCCLLADVLTEKTSPPPQKEGCGWRNPNGISVHFPISGNESKYAEFPWMVAILQILSSRINYLGGGSLVHPRAVLTAAHVVHEKTGLTARAGDWDTQTMHEIYPHQDRDVEVVTIHKDFNKKTLFYNIALLFLDKPMVMAPNVGVICLPPPRFATHSGTKCLASGWGKDRFGKDGQYSVILKKVELPVVSKNECQNKLRTTRLGSLFELNMTFMCAGGEEGRDTCTGDGGSPLVCPVDVETNRYVQSGIVAWGVGCGGDGLPAVYVDVARQRAWVDDKLAAHGLTLDNYTYNYGY